jgi:hypothetical protein
MPSIDYSGDYFVQAICTSSIGAPYHVKDSRGAIGFPVRASRPSVARRFASRKILDLLHGWQVGSVTLFRQGKQVDTWMLRKE